MYLIYENIFVQFSFYEKYKKNNFFIYVIVDGIITKKNKKKYTQYIYIYTQTQYIF